MKQRPWLRFVHWFGYASSAIVVAQLLFVGYLTASEWKRRYDWRQETRMRLGPATDRLRALDYSEREIALLGSLPPLSRLAPDGFRIVATPSFGHTDFTISFRRTKTGGEGLMIMAPASDANGPIKTVRLKLSPEAYSSLTTRMDNLAASWDGESGRWTDGTGIVFERVGTKGVTSGFGNSPRFYGEIGALVFNSLQTSTPELAPFDDSWHPKDRR